MHSKWSSCCYQHALSAFRPLQLRLDDGAVAVLCAPIVIKQSIMQKRYVPKRYEDGHGTDAFPDQSRWKDIPQSLPEMCPVWDNARRHSFAGP